MTDRAASTGRNAGRTEVHFVPYGRSALELLDQSIRRRQADDPLAPVTVIVERNLVGLAVRRALAGALPEQPARTSRSDRARGVVNVAFATLSQLAEQLAGAELARAGRSPLSETVRQAAIRTVLARRPSGRLSALRHHGATVRSVSATYQDLRGVPVETLHRIAAADPRASEAIEIIKEVRALVGERYYDETDLLHLALDAMEKGRADLGTLAGVIVYLPHRLTGHRDALVRALGERIPCTVLSGVSGDSRTDEADFCGVSTWAEQWGSPLVEPPRIDAPSCGALISAPSADAEVLHTVRLLMQRNAEGVSLESMAIAYTQDDPYGRLLRDTLERFAIPFNGGEVRRLSSTSAGRTLLGLLELPDHDWQRSAIIDWLSSCPIIFDGSEVPASAWDLVSAEAGVIGGVAQWSDRLAGYVASQRGALERAESDHTGESPAGRAEAHRRRILEAEAMVRFLEQWHRRLREAPRTWREWSDWGQRALRDLLGSDARQMEWPIHEAEAFTSLVELLRSMADLDDFGEAPDRSAFRASLVGALEERAPQVARFGQGIFLGKVGGFAGLHFDTLFVVGMHEGSIGRRVSDDPVLPDRVRACGGADVPLSADPSGEDHWTYLTTVSSAQRCTLSFARGDQRKGRAQRPSRWWLDSLEKVSESPRRLFSRDLDGMAPIPGYTVLHSLTDTVSRSGEAAGVVDLDLRALLTWRDAGEQIDHHWLLGDDPALDGVLSARRCRRSVDFTRFDGRIGGDGAPSPALGIAQSPTRLEDFARCPRKYLFSALLRLEERELPDEIDRISALDRGSLIHQALEEFIALEVRKPADERIRPGADWPSEAADRLREIGERVCAEYEARGLAGRAVYWRIDRAEILRDLHSFLRYDSMYRAELGAVPEATELGFGGEVGNPVTVGTGAGAAVPMKGYIDRIDRAPDAMVVIDYKTGRPWEPKNGSDDPVAKGTRLQLPVYALAAREMYRLDSVHSYYWYVTERGGFERRGFTVDAAVLERFATVLGTIVVGIEKGHFPARPGPGRGNCRYCPFDALCPSSRDREWERKKFDPLLASYLSLSEPEALETPT